MGRNSSTADLHIRHIRNCKARVMHKWFKTRLQPKKYEFKYTFQDRCLPLFNKFVRVHLLFGAVFLTVWGGGYIPSGFIFQLSQRVAISISYSDRTFSVFKQLKAEKQNLTLASILHDVRCFYVCKPWPSASVTWAAVRIFEERRKLYDIGRVHSSKI